MSARVFFYVQHLLGIGHLRRAATLARALASGGFDVLLVSGGAPVDGLPLEGVRFHQLPPLRAADLRLKELSQLDGTPLDDVFRAKRTCVLLDLFEAEAPDILLTEQFPFGRTQLRFELMPLLEAAQRRPSAPQPNPEPTKPALLSSREVADRLQPADRPAFNKALWRAAKAFRQKGCRKPEPLGGAGEGWALAELGDGGHGRGHQLVKTRAE